MQSYQDIKRGGMISIASCYDYETLIPLFREHAQDVYKMAGGCQICQTQTCDSSTMRGRDETYPPSDFVGQMEGEIPGHPAAAFGETVFMRNWTPLMVINSQAESFVFQKQTNLVFYTFGIWHSKTRVSRGPSNGYQSNEALMNTHASSSPFPLSALMLLT